MLRTTLCLVCLLRAQILYAAPSVEKDFFKGDVSTRLERLETYPLEEQYRIFLYGNQVIHPPSTGLAIPIAKRGKIAADYILRRLDTSKNDLDFRDSMVVFQSMQWGGHFDLCGHPKYMNEIAGNASKIEYEGWRKVYLEMLKELCR